MKTVTYKTAMGTFTAQIPAGMENDFQFLALNYLNQAAVTDVSVDGVPYKTGGTVVRTGYEQGAYGPTPPPGYGAVTSQGWGPEAEYLQSIGQGTPGYRDPSQRYRANLYDPIRALFQLEEKVNPEMGRAPAGDWASYVPQFGVGGYGAIAGRAREVLSRLLGMTPAARELGGLSTQPSYDPETGGAELQPGAMSPAELQNLVRLGGASAFGRGGARWVAGRMPEMRTQWEAAGAGGNQPLSFLDYFKQRYGL